jgi:hypothetical protein
VFALAACACGLAPRASTTPLASASRSTTPSPTPSSSLAGQALSCRLPVRWAAQDGFKGGFLTFPDQVLTVDPTASGFYDRAYAKWLPALRAQVSPDGRRYAYAGEQQPSYAGSKLHVVDVATGVDQVIYSGDTAYTVVDFAAAGIYVTSPTPDGATRGLWLEDPSGGQPKLISSEILDPAVGGGAAWGPHFNAADPSPVPVDVEGPRNEVLRFDLRTGTATGWFYRPGARVWILGFDAAGHPFVRVYTEANMTEPVELWLVQSQTQAIRLFAGHSPDPSLLGAVDSHGVWFDSFRASPTVWLYAGGSLQKVATVDPVDVHDMFVAGGCIP